MKYQMNKGLIITLVLMVFWLVACAPTASPILPIYPTLTSDQLTAWAPATHAAATANAGQMSTAWAVSVTATPHAAAAETIPAPAVKVVGQFTDTVEQWRPEIDRWAVEYGGDGITGNLIATIIQMESCGNPAYDAPGPRAGLFGVETFYVPEGQDVFKWDTNAKIGLAILADVRKQTNDMALVWGGWKSRNNMIKSFDAWTYDGQRFFRDAGPIYDGAESGDGGVAITDWLMNGDGVIVCAGARVFR